jgi:hypothetical protein
MGARIAMRKTPFVVAAAATLPLLAGACSVDKRSGVRTLTGAAVGAAAGAAGGFVYDQIKKD